MCFNLIRILNVFKHLNVFFKTTLKSIWFFCCSDFRIFFIDKVAHCCWSWPQPSKFQLLCHFRANDDYCIYEVIYICLHLYVLFAIHRRNIIFVDKCNESFFVIFPKLNFKDNLYKRVKSSIWICIGLI